eukprot:12992864-Alexandrium_andersonii.AAC.1
MPLAGFESMSSKEDGTDRPPLAPIRCLGQPSIGGVTGCLLCHQPWVSLTAPACDARVLMHGARCTRVHEHTALVH